MKNETTHERAIQAYVRAVSAAEPLRIRLWDERGLTMSQLRLMYLIKQNGEPSIGDMAAEMRVRPATLTGVVQRLIKHRLVQRHHDTQDLRVVRLRLTAEGKRVLGEVAVAGRAFLEAVFLRLGPDAVHSLALQFEQFADTAEEIMEQGEYSV